MDRQLEAVALSIYTQLIHENISFEQADKIVATISTALKVRNVPFDSEAFENLALRGEG